MEQLPPEVRGLLGYVGYAALAFAGSFMRASKWRDETTGKIVWWRVMSEVPIAIATGAVSVGIGEYYHLDPKIIGGICGLLGLLGPAVFTSATDTLMAILRHRFGGV